MSHSSSTCLTKIFFLILIMKSSFSMLTDLTWQAESSLSKQGMKGFVWNTDMPESVPHPISPAFISPFPLHLCQSFPVLCISTISPQRGVRYFSFKQHSPENVYVSAADGSLGWDPSVTNTLAVPMKRHNGKREWGKSDLGQAGGLCWL